VLVVAVQQLAAPPRVAEEASVPTYNPTIIENDPLAPFDQNGYVSIDELLVRFA
jgi:hypothetical protein